MQPSSGVTTFLFTDIEGSSRLWEEFPDRMGAALARHDELARAAIAGSGGIIVKMTGDGVHAAFDDPRDAVRASIAFQQALYDAAKRGGLALSARCGLHAGVVERRDNDYFGTAVNRAARIMSAAHGGQILVSQALADLVRPSLPAGVTLRDLGIVRLRDLASPERLHQLIHPGLRSSFPPLRSLESFPNNLPQQLTSFIGREREISQIGEALAGQRLVTLRGPGGIGKTRLSLQVAADVLARFPDGTWFVELAPLVDEQRVPQAVAAVLGIKEDAGKPIVDTLLRVLRERKLLLILDNCEHVVKACAELAATLLAGTPDVRILATTREPLNVRGESTVSVPVLGLPRATSGAAIEAPTQYEAIRLFVERARAVNSDFAITPSNADAVVDICRRLDGIPLALELAAARVRALSVRDIAARLADRFRLLAHGERSAVPRQQTLRALIDWSHGLLTDAERVLFRRLAVFSGGWELEAAETVCADATVDETRVLDLQSRLVEKSLVVMEAGGRYRLLDTVREYAREHLDVSDDAKHLRARHRDYYVAFAEQARTHLFGPGEAQWLPRLDAERENLLSAHAHCDHADGGADAGLRLVSALKPYLFNRGMLGLAYRITVEALAREAAQDPTIARCRGLFDAGQICFFMGRYADAVRLLEQSLAIARAHDDAKQIARALQPLGMACLGEGEWDAARGYLEEALARARKEGDQRQLAAALNALGQLLRVEGALDDAQPLYEQALAIAQQAGDREVVAVALLNLAIVDVQRGFAGQAGARLLDVLAIASDIGSKPAGQSAVEVAAGLAARAGDWSRAARLFGVAEEQTSYTGIHRDPADEAFLAPLIGAVREAAGSEAFDAAETAGRALAYDDAITELRAWLEGAAPSRATPSSGAINS